MKELDRREVLTAILGGGAIVAVGVTAMPKVARSLPLGAVKAGVVEPGDLVEEARVTVHVHPRRWDACSAHVAVRRAQNGPAPTMEPKRSAFAELVSTDGD